MRRPLFTFGVLSSFLSMPFMASAASLPLFDGNFSIVPDQCRACACGMGGVLQTVQNLMNVGISIGVVALTLFIAWAGFLFMMSATNPESRSQARGMLINAFIGMVIVLSAWMIVDFVMKKLYDGSNAQFGPWNAILQVSDGTQCIQPVTVSPITGLPGIISVITAPATGGGVTPTPSTVSGNEAAVRQQLASAGVSINNAPCASGSNGSGCTNVGGMRATTIAQVITINRACGGSCVVVTGGSEPGHASGTYSHGNGYKVDIRDTSPVNNLLNTLTHTGERGGDSGGPIFKDTCGNQYVHEATHWDITVFNECSL